MPCYDYPYYKSYTTNIYNPKRFPLYNAYDLNLVYPRCTYKGCECSAFNIRDSMKCKNLQSKKYWKAIN